MEPRDLRSTVLTPLEEAMVVAFRQRTLLPLDDVMGCLHDSIPKLTRSSLTAVTIGMAFRDCWSMRPRRNGAAPGTTIGHVHIDSCELRHADSKIQMFLAMDRVSKFIFVAFYENAGTMNGAAFLRGVV